MKRLFLSLYIFSLFSCLPGPPRTIVEFQKPSCSDSRTAEELDLERQKQNLFQIIENSNRYQNEEQRRAALKSYKTKIAAKERSSCPEDVERFIEDITSIQ